LNPPRNFLENIFKNEQDISKYSFNYCLFIYFVNNFRCLSTLGYTLLRITSDKEIMTKKKGVDLVKIKFHLNENIQ